MLDSCKLRTSLVLASKWRIRSPESILRAPSSLMRYSNHCSVIGSHLPQFVPVPHASYSRTSASLFVLDSCTHNLSPTTSAIVPATLHLEFSRREGTQEHHCRPKMNLLLLLLATLVNSSTPMKASVVRLRYLSSLDPR